MAKLLHMHVRHFRMCGNDELRFGVVLLDQAGKIRYEIFRSLVYICVSWNEWNFENVQERNLNKWFNFSFLWNNDTPMAYLVEMCFTFIVGQSFLLCVGSLQLLYISICLHHRAFYKVIQNSLHTLDHADRHQNYEVFLCKLIRFHISTKRWDFCEF